LAVVTIVVVVVANVVYEANEASTINAANEALSELNADVTNEEALSRLESLSPSLYDAFIFSRAIADKDVKALEALKSSKTILVGDLATYESAQAAKDSSALSSYALQQNAIYKDLAQVQNAIILMNEGQTDKAHEILNTINESSSLNKVVKALLHYGVK